MTLGSFLKVKDKAVNSWRLTVQHLNIMTLQREQKWWPEEQNTGDRIVCCTFCSLQDKQERPGELPYIRQRHGGKE